MIILGDFNCDIIRRNETDKLMTSWLNSNNYVCKDVIKMLLPKYTYNKDDKTSWMDHIVCTTESEYVDNIKIDASKWNCGDHLALNGTLTTASSNGKQAEIKDEPKKGKIIWN